MTDGASGRSIDELPEDRPPKMAGIMLSIVIGIFCILSAMFGYGIGKSTNDCPNPVYRLHKHEVGK